MERDATNPAASETIYTSQQRVAALNRLLEVTRRLAAEINLDKILGVIGAEACQALACERATVYQYNEQTGDLVTLAATDLEIAEIRHPLDQGISGYAARERTLVNVPDPSADPRWNSQVDRQTGYHTRSILAAPLVSPHDDALLGVLELLNNIGGPFDTFDEELIVAFAAHASVALDRARLVERSRRNQAVEASLQIARDIQRGFMPGQLADIAGYDVATWWFPQQAVGGDYCDVLPLRGGDTGLIIADVSGHGLGPSLLMASTRAALRALLLDHSSPEVLLRLLAESLASDLVDGHFITMVVAVLDPVTHTLSYANAGHAPALHYMRSADCFVPLKATGLPMGVADKPDFPAAPPLRLAAGDMVVLCTDGIVEAMDAEDRPFGLARLEQVVREHAEEPMAELVRHVGEQVEQFYVGDHPADDLTILVARRNP
ncbi:MAG TPA: GAF domain-containing SpoIIE family protein phosphatase [Pirellulales bacterium]|jgi:serine phosphatase RsbU (regulator of sigma subunit)